jgi:ABC-2 type transport system permease protein
VTAFLATTRYELRMQLRRPALWVTFALLLVMLAAFSGFLSAWHETDPKIAMVRTAIAVEIPLPIGYAFLLADRMVRDARLDVADLFDAAPANRLGRLLGKYTGSSLATALPIVTIYFGYAISYAVAHRCVAALAWALAVFATVLLPGLAFAGALALCLPLVVPPSVFRTIFVGFWVWSSWLIPATAVPTLAQTVLSPTNGYPLEVFFGYHGGHGGTNLWAGPAPGAVLNALRPTPNVATTWLSIALLLATAAAVLALAHVLRTRPAR